MQPTADKECYFYVYCEKCIHKDLDEHDEKDDTCNECLTHPVNEWSHRPINYKEATK
jgi:hypothetical protein